MAMRQPLCAPVANLRSPHSYSSIGDREQTFACRRLHNTCRAINLRLLSLHLREVSRAMNVQILILAGSTLPL